jgi:hypothetical protein
MRFIPVDQAIQSYFSSGVIPTDRLPVLIQFAELAIEIDPHHRYHDGLSTLHYLRAIDRRTPALQRLEAYRAAEREAIKSLARAPAQSSIWLRVSQIRWMLHDEPEQVVGPWKMSLFTSRTDTPQYAQRVEIGVAFSQYLDEEGLAMLRDQLLRAWRNQPGRLAKILEDRDPELSVTRELIGKTDPLALLEIEEWIEKIP